MAKYKLPNYQNATPAFLLDQLAEIRAKLNHLKALEKFTKTALEARVKDDPTFWETPQTGETLEGKHRFIAVRESYPRHAVDQTAVKTLADNPKFQEMMKEIGIPISTLFSDTEVFTIRFSPAEGFNPEEAWGVEAEDVFKQWGLPDNESEPT